jgi:hypothetical protein
MEFTNATRMEAGYTIGVEAGGRELLVVAVKGTFRIPREAGGKLVLHDEQVPLVMSDVFCGKPGVSAPKYEIDFAPRKLRCDVLLNGHAYAPGGRPTERVIVGASIGGWSKTFAVVGDRVWLSRGGIRATPPVPFVEMPISYERAFGGVDQAGEDPEHSAAYLLNPAGRGFHKYMDSESLEGSPLPNTEEAGAEVRRPDGAYRPMSFGALGRHWEPRCRYAGTYDQHWLEHVFPFLPADFDEQYYQAAPLDQQLPLPVGAQTVSLVNLTPDGRRDFSLPHFEAPIYVFPKEGEPEELSAPVDTILIEPDLERLTMTWRIARPLRRNLFEIEEVLVGRQGPAWWQQRELAAFPIPVVVEPMASGPTE